MYGGLARTITADVLRYNDAAGQEPDQALLERAAQILAPSDEAKAEREKLKTIVRSILEAADKTRTRKPLTAAGARRGDGKTVSVDHLRGTVSRQMRGAR
jgi:hypothetical protein